MQIRHLFLAHICVVHVRSVQLLRVPHGRPQQLKAIMHCVKKFSRRVRGDRAVQVRPFVQVRRAAAPGPQVLRRGQDWHCTHGISSKWRREKMRFPA